MSVTAEKVPESEMISRKKILLVDDEPDAIEYLQTVLEDNSYQVMTARSTVEGMMMIKEDRPDLICLDILMPEESGISLYQKLRQDPALKDIPVFFSSGLNIIKDLHKIGYRKLKDGTVIPEPDGVIEKPINVSKVIQLVRETLE